MKRIKRKVLAYITKGEGRHRKLLVYEQTDQPEAGLQVPGGTIERNELLLDALYREIEEESGILRDELILEGKVKSSKFFPEDKNVIYERTIFHFSYVGTKDENEWEYRVEGEGKDAGLLFSYRWMPLNAVPKLAAKQGEAIEYI
ncbi:MULTISPECIES: NUDIX hydrolase [Sporosarcina]|uniref:NUDIX hydrolase n=1 Tax=Sporosarcina TaxID=1569 RepID=UPI00129ACDA1|nr:MULTISPECIES: NUDIX domain-containing protein [Sporosarcina]GKV67041.1 DNA mismatch repair protein MutT [Sporosarcina sp. NCCP-2331]GLB57371.1 DNA mismatch repair protein MutT [Sporosarcina sp. NCCP-2378]